MIREESRDIGGRSGKIWWESNERSKQSVITSSRNGLWGNNYKLVIMHSPDFILRFTLFRVSF